MPKLESRREGLPDPERGTPRVGRDKGDTGVATRTERHFSLSHVWSRGPDPRPALSPLTAARGAGPGLLAQTGRLRHRAVGGARANPFLTQRACSAAVRREGAGGGGIGGRDASAQCLSASDARQQSALRSGIGSVADDLPGCPPPPPLTP